TSNQLLEVPLTTRTLTHHRLSVEKRCSTGTTVSPSENDSRVHFRKIISGASPPIHTPAEQRWSTSPSRPNGCALAAAAWLIQASETRRTTLSSQANAISPLRALTWTSP